MSLEMVPDGDFLFKIVISCLVIIIIYFIYNLFSKMKEINNKIDSVLTETPMLQELPNNITEDVSVENEKKESNVDLSGVDLPSDLDTIEE